MSRDGKSTVTEMVTARVVIIDHSCIMAFLGLKKNLLSHLTKKLDDIYLAGLNVRDFLILN